MTEQNQVTFRRIRGRIVPIPMNRVNRLKETKEGSALTAAGVATTVGAGMAYKRVAGMAIRNSVRGLRSIERLKFRPGKVGYQLSFSQAARVQQVKGLADKLFKSARFLGTSSKALQIGGIFAGSVLIGAGAAKLARAYSGKRDDTREALIGTTASALAFNAKPAAEALFRAGVYPKPAAREAIKKAIPFISKFFRG